MHIIEKLNNFEVLEYRSVLRVYETHFNRFRDLLSDAEREELTSVTTVASK